LIKTETINNESHTRLLLLLIADADSLVFLFMCIPAYLNVSLE